MADRYWVGGTANWDATAGTKWSATSGGAGGAAVPTSNDNVFFDAASGAVTVTISATVAAKSINCTGFTGTLGGAGNITVAGSITLFAGMTFNYAAIATITGSGTITSAGKVWTGSTLWVQGAGITVDLGDAFSTTTALVINTGTFTTNNYAVTATSLSSSNSNTRTINLGSSTVTLTGNSGWNCSTSTNLTLNSGTSSIVLSSASSALDGGGRTYNDVSFTSTALVGPVIGGANTFNNLSIMGRTSAGVAPLAIFADQTINGTLTLSAGTNATCRTFVRSNTLGTTRTLTCAAVASLTDIDFRDITIAGAAAPVSGTRLGDCKGNSGIMFDAAKTVYVVATNTTQWSNNIWAASIGGGANAVNFPLAQDTAVIPSANPTSGQTVTVNAAYNIGTIDMSARTSNTMTLATGSTTPAIYGNWINGTGTTLTGTGTLTFAGRGSQTITSAGKTFTQAFTINSPSGSVTLQDAFTSTLSGTALNVTAGTIDANGYNVTFSNASANINVNNSNVRTVAIGVGTWTVAGSGNVWNATTSTNLTVTGTGTISLTSASGKNFIGGGIQTYPAINQGGIGTLTITGSNKFANITNTAIGRVQFTGGTTNEFGAFNLNGVLGNLLQVGSTNTTQALLKAPSWNVGLLSTDAGNNTGLSFTGVSPNYLSISYINGQISAAPITSYLGNFFAFF